MPILRRFLPILILVGSLLSPAATFAQGAQVTVGGPFEGEASALTGAGATFPAPLYDAWFQTYNQMHNTVQIDYQANGSGAGITGCIAILPLVTRIQMPMPLTRYPYKTESCSAGRCTDVPLPPVVHFRARQTR